MILINKKIQADFGPALGYVIHACMNNKLLTLLTHIIFTRNIELINKTMTIGD